jgi:peptidoglycan/LPS O-acetylase OafA/YrhL
MNRLQNIQILRAVAALSVVAFHGNDVWRERLGGHFPIAWSNGAAGVDIFFVISGFVMVVSSRKLSRQQLGWWRFLAARLRRIVPLYWLCSCIKIVLVWLLPGAVLSSRIGWAYCAASFLFLPVHDAAGHFRPLMPVGWTLSFEMMFYALFAACLAARRNPRVWLPPALLLITLLPRANGSVAGELCKPVLLEFGYGIILASFYLKGWHLPRRAAWPMLAASVVLLALLPAACLGSRAFSWGIPASGLIAAAVALEAQSRLRPRGSLVSVMLTLGDASYAIYLTHGLTLAGVALCLARVPGTTHVLVICYFGAIAASALVGWFVHVLIEKPLLGWGISRAAIDEAPAVLVLAGGGMAPLSGGVGVLMRYLMDAWAGMEAAPRIRIVDTRGSGGRFSFMPWFAASFACVALLGLAGRINLVHAHMASRGSAARKTLLCGLAMMLGIPVVMHMHGADFLPFYRRLHPVSRAPLRFVLRRARLVIVLGTAWRDFLIHEVGLSPARISIVPNGVPRPPTVGSGRAHRPSKIVFLGRLCARKGVPELIAALASPCVRALDWQAVIAGDGDPAPYRAMLGWHRLGPRVSLPGWIGRPETAALLSESDIFVLPSHHEAMPVAVLEAMAAGIAVITTPVGTLPEFLQHNVNALLVPPGSPAQLAEAIALLLQDVALRRRLAEAGHAVFCDRLEISHVASRIAGLYRDVLRPTSAASFAAPQPAE